MKPTIYDVANEAGVSIATVSKVINNSGRISDKTRRKVINIMKELRYQPSVVASALTGKRTSTIGLLIPDLANPFFAEIARHIENRGQEIGLSIVMCSTDYDAKKERKYITLLRQKQVDGFILASGFQDIKTLKELINDKVPIALIAQEFPSLAIHSITVDDFLGGYQLTDHLLRLGHKKIAVIAERVQSGPIRIGGYRQALKDAEVEYDESLVVTIETTIEAAYHQTLRLLERPEPPTAIFATNDILAVGTIQAAQECGLHIPNDLSVAGFDNTIMSRIVNPPLTTVAQPIQDMGRQVIDLLMEQIENQSKTKQKITLLPELIVRGSTTAPKSI